MKKSKLLSIVFSMLIALFWITIAIAFPILCRPYYYACAKIMKLSEVTGFSTDVIHGAYNEVMDYLVFGGEFGTGELRWSQSGMSHFADCRGLFRLDFIVLGLSAIGLLAIYVYKKKCQSVTGKFKDCENTAPKVSCGEPFLHRFFGKSPAFVSAFVVTVIFTIVAVWAVADFNSLFTFFHAVCFPGKTNWIFDWRTDQIILILPEAFWAMTGALVVILSLGGLWITAILAEFLSKRNLQ